MKAIRTIIELPDEYTHPLHAFVCQSSAVEREILLDRSYTEDTRTHLFYVEGDQSTYESQLSLQEDVEKHEITASDDIGFYTYMHGPIRETERDLFEGLEQETVVIASPIEFLSDQTMRLTFVGPPEEIQTAVDTLPENARVDISKIGEYSTGGPRRLTDRQMEALETAWDCGYFSVPRKGTIEDVAQELDRSVSTTSELIRRGERSLIDAALERPI